MVDMILQNVWAEISEYLHEEERDELTACAKLLVAHLEETMSKGDPDAMDDVDASDASGRTVYEFGYRMAKRQAPLERLLKLSRAIHRQLVSRQEPGDDPVLLTAWVHQYTNRMLEGYHQCRSEQQARHYEWQRNQVLEALPISVVVYDAEGRCLYANKNCHEQSGTTNEMVIGKTRAELAGEYNDHEDPTGAWERVCAGERVKIRIESFSTEEGLMMNDKHLIPLADPEGTINGVVSVCFQSVSEKERLHNLQKQFSFVLNSMNSGLLILNREGTVTGFNHKAEEILGLRAEDVLGQYMGDLTRRYVEGRNEITGEYPPLIPLMERGTPIREIEYAGRIAGRRLLLRVSGNPIKNAQGMTVGYILIFDDQTELVQMREAVDRNEKFALIGQFAAGIAHEIRNPLTTVDGFLQLYADGEVKHEYFLDLTKTLLLPEIDRANTILSDFLMVSRPQAPLRSTVDTRSFVADVVRLVESEAHLRGVLLHVEAPDVLPALFLDVQQMKQVFLNLCKNAFDVTPQGGRLTLRVQDDPDGQRVQFFVVDEGPGIPAEDLCHIFEPFYTTKDHGTGLGLPISHRIVEGHGGALQVRSAEGAGTTFVISIPLQTKNDHRA